MRQVTTIQARLPPIYGLDLARFAAALAVLAYHLAFKPFAVGHNPLHKQLGGEIILPSGWEFSFWGWIGVQIFFVISGVVISYSAANARPWKFFSGRVSRLWPAMIVCASFCALVSLWLFDTAPDLALFLWLKSIVFFPFSPWIAGQIWTLPIEICFYALIWAFIKLNWQERFGLLAWIMALSRALYWSIKAIGYSDPYGPITLLLLLQHGCYFALGMAISATDGLPRRWKDMLLYLLCIVTAYAQINNTAIAEARGSPLADLHLPVFIIWLAGILLIAGSTHWRDWIAKLLTPISGVVRMMGLMTYPLYLVHVHAGGMALLIGLACGIATGWSIALAALASLITAYAITRFAEPALRLRIEQGLKWLEVRFSKPGSVAEPVSRQV